jgi:glycosidase
MTHRARVAAIACPEALIDMDNWPMRDKATWREYLGHKPSLGIPALYYTSHIDMTGEPLTEEDYALLRSTWADYRAAIADHRRKPAKAKIHEPGGIFHSPLFRRLSNTQPLIAKPLKAFENKGSEG